jgi:hypothetical protein
MRLCVCDLFAPTIRAKDRVCLPSFTASRSAECGALIDEGSSAAEGITRGKAGAERVYVWFGVPRLRWFDMPEANTKVSGEVTGVSTERRRCNRER